MKKAKLIVVAKTEKIPNILPGWELRIACNTAECRLYQDETPILTDWAESPAKGRPQSPYGFELTCA